MVAEGMADTCVLGKKKECNPKPLGPDTFQWGGDLPREGAGGQKVWYVPRNLGKPNFLAGCPGEIAGIARGCLKKLKRMFVFDSCHRLSGKHKSWPMPPGNPFTFLNVSLHKCKMRCCKQTVRTFDLRKMCRNMTQKWQRLKRKKQR